MEHGLSLSQKQTQSLAMTQQMEQSIKILEMDMVELREYVQKEALENPAIDMDSIQEDSPAALRKKKLEWLEQQAVKDKQFVGYYDPQQDYSLEKTVAAREDTSLAAHLLEQCSLYCDKASRPVTEFVIGFLDDDGYLRASLSEMLEECGFSREALEAAIKTVQGFDPPGVGAGDLAHCLLLQLPQDAGLERSVVSSCMEHLAKNRPDRAAKELHVSKEEAAAAFARIRQLNPKPGSAFSPSQPPLYVIPDVIVTSFQDRYYVLPCEFSYPTIRLSASMQEIMNASQDKEVVQYISRKIKQAQWIEKCIASRGETLMAVARAIVQHQENFFRYGPHNLKILRMSDVAEALGMHESTISRAVRNKYLQCSYGTFPLRHFFVQGLRGTGDAEDTSSHNIKGVIRELIAGENKEEPLSDQKIADILVKQGTEISRRTVAKYRDQLGIPNSAYRR